MIPLIDQSVTVSDDSLTSRSKIQRRTDLLDHILLGLFPDLDIKQYARMHAQLQVLLQSVVPTTRLPTVRVETQTQGLSKVVQL